MKTHLQHLTLNSSDFKRALDFYKELLEYFEYKTISEHEDYAGFSNGTTDIWLNETEPEYAKQKFHRKNPGLNHLAFSVAGRAEVDRFTKEFLRPRGIAPLYGSPKFFPEYTPDYYAVYFEDPERLKLEVVCGDEK